MPHGQSASDWASGEGVLGHDLGESLFQRAPPQVELPQRPAVGHQFVADRLAQVFRILGSGLRKQACSPSLRSSDHAFHPGNRLEHGPDRIGRPPGLQHDRACRRRFAS